MDSSLAPRAGVSRNAFSQRRPALDRLYLARLEDAGALAYLALFVVLFGTHGDMAARTFGWLPLRPTVAYVVMALPILAYVLVRELRGDPSAILETWRQNAPLLVPLVVSAGLALVLSAHPTANWGQSGASIVYPAYNVLVLAIAMVLPLLRVVRRHFTALVAGVLGVLLATTFADLLVPGLFSKHPGRPAGLPENANASAFLMLVACAAALDGRRSRAYNLAVVLATGAGVLLTLSRGGILLFALLLAVHGLYSLGAARRPLRSHLPTLVLGLAGLAVVGAGAGYLIANDVGPFSQRGVQKRLDQLASGRLVSADDARIVLAREYTETIAASPLLGHGAGYASSLPKGPHNRFLYEWTNGGLAGLGAYVAFLSLGLVLFLRRRSRAGVVLMVVVIGYSLLSHTLIESRALLLLLGMQATLSSPLIARTEASEAAEA